MRNLRLAPDGTRFIFNVLEQTTTNNPTTLSAPCTTAPATYTSSWFLHKIISPYNNSQFIELHYDDYYIQREHLSGESRQYLLLLVDDQGNPVDDECSGVFSGQGVGASSSQISINSKVLRQVTTSSQQHKVDFLRYTNRYDINQTVSGAPILKRLDEIRLSSADGSILQKHVLDYYDTPYSGRLLLESIQQQSPNGIEQDIPPYEFIYDASQLPIDVDSKSIDHWGFYNGSTNSALPSYIHQIIPGNYVHFEGSNRTPNPVLAEAQVLTEIHYPTGKIHKFEYEGNDYAWVSNAAVSSLDQYAVFPQSVLIPEVQGDGTNTFVCETTLFSISPGSPSVAITVVIEGTTHSNFGGPAVLPHITLEDNGGNILRTWSIIPPSGASLPYNETFFDYITLPPGNYTIKAKAQGNDDIEGNLDWKEVNLASPLDEKLAGGVRVKKIETYDIDGSVENIRTFEYELNGKSSGVIYAEPTYVYMSSLIEDDSNGNATICDYINLLGFSRYQIGATSGSHIGYRRVTEYQGMNGENGKTVYDFRSPFDVPDIINTAKPFAAPVSNGHQTGLVEVKTAYEKIGSNYVEVHRTEYDYQVAIKDVDYIKLEYGRFSPPVFRTGSYDITDFNLWGNYGLLSFSDRFAHSTVSMRTGHVQVEEMREYYSYSGITGSVERTEQFVYDSDLQLLKETKIIDSDETAYISKIKYPLDYNIGTAVDDASIALQALQDKHIINVPIESSQYIQKRNRIEQLIHSKVCEYDLHPTTNHPYKKNIWQTELRVPIPAYNLTLSQVSSGSFNKANIFTNHGVAEAQFYHDAYDEFGNLIEYHQEKDQTDAIIWGYSHTLPTAFIQNAKHNETAFTSFEEDSGVNSQSGWTHSLFSFLLDGDAKIGTQSYLVSTGISPGTPLQTSSNNLPNQKYILSFWAKPVVATSSPSILIDVNNGTDIIENLLPNSTEWEHHEILLDNPMGVKILVNGSDARIDELRLYPADALMMTYTYYEDSRLLAGTADESNVPTTYEYDDLLRLSTVRDFEGNITQAIDYGYHDAGIGQNYIYTQNVLVENQLDINSVNSLSVSNAGIGEVARTYQFFDGLSRPIQSVGIEASPKEYDIVSFQNYDDFGRADKSHLPYTIDHITGTYFHSNYMAEHSTFYTALANNNNELSLSPSDANYAFVKYDFEASPLNRSIGETPPGAAWNNKTVQNAYRMNFAWEQVHDFNQGYRNNDHYPEGELYVVQSTDEDGNQSRSYIDKLQRVVMVEREVDGTDFARTYTVYDDFGNTRAVIPPQAAEDMKQDDNWNIYRLKNFRKIYAYNYDERQRPREKYVPGGGTTLYHHNKLDLPVMVTDDNERQTITKYDILKRPIATGEYTGTLTPDTDSNTQEYEESNTSTHNYTFNNSFPSNANVGSSLHLHQLTYYDEYQTSFLASPTDPEYETIASDWVRNQITATKTGILSPTGTTTFFLEEHIFYDQRARVIQTQSDNHLGGKDIVHNAYNFPGWLVRMQRDHDTNTPAVGIHDYTIRYEYRYDHAGRLDRIYHQVMDNIAGIAGPNQFMVSNLYDERGFLEEKRLHRTGINSAPNDPIYLNYWQYIDYRYNIRSWLTDINNVNSISHCASSMVVRTPEGKEQSDLFSMKLGYQTTGGIATGQFNGNIATLTWRTGCADDTHQYGFTYDKLNRLLDANYHVNGSYTQEYDVEQIAYDLDGNIQTLARKYSPTGSASFMDVLQYRYNDLIPNHLNQVRDLWSGAPSTGFQPSASTNSSTDISYTYDDAGNLTRDEHKGADILYNYMNLPKQVNFATGNIQWTYRADGQKLTKTVNPGTTKQYCNGIEYNNTQLEAIYHEEGRVTKLLGTWRYEYTITDHLGNVRVMFSDIDGDNQPDILQDQAYYPFGMQIEELSMSNLVNPNEYKFNGIEECDDLGLDVYTAVFRTYDPAIARWWQIDPRYNVTESPFTMVGNNPIKNYDMLGDTLRGVNEQSAQRALELINETGINASGIFRLGEDGKTFESISLIQFVNGTEGFSNDQMKLAFGYMLAANENNTNVVEVVKRSEAISAYGQSALRGLAKTGAELDKTAGGGRTESAFYEPGTVNKGNQGSYAALVLDSQSISSDMYSDGQSRSSLPGELLAHELLGHGLGGDAYSGVDQSIQMTNAYLRATGRNYHRPDHGAAEHSPNFTSPFGTPTYIVSYIQRIKRGRMK